jgi:hypothetical protein
MIIGGISNRIFSLEDEGSCLPDPFSASNRTLKVVDRSACAFNAPVTSKLTNPLFLAGFPTMINGW